MAMRPYGVSFGSATTVAAGPVEHSVDPCLLSTSTSIDPAIERSRQPYWLISADEIRAPAPSTQAMASVELWCRVTVVGPDGTEVGACELEGSGAPDLSVVDVVARLALLAKRLGGRVVLRSASAGLLELLDLAALGVEVGGQPEGGEEALRIDEVEEERHLGDAAP